MEFTKEMVDIVRGIKSHAPPDIAARVKFADPSLFEYLEKILVKCGDTVCKLLIKELFALAGYTNANKEEIEARRLHKRVYRGQVQEGDVVPSTSSAHSDTSTRPKSKRIYRGQVIE